MPNAATLAARSKPSTLFPRERLVELAIATNNFATQPANYNYVRTRLNYRIHTARHPRNHSKIEKIQKTLFDRNSINSTICTTELNLLDAPDSKTESTTHPTTSPNRKNHNSRQTTLNFAHVLRRKSRNSMYSIKIPSILQFAPTN